MTGAAAGNTPLAIGVGVTLAVVAYLLGGIPWSLIVVKKKAGIDLRTVGSGNLGSTNVSRVLSGKYAVLVFFLDMAKGALAVTAAMVASSVLFGRHSAAYDWITVITVISAVLGHMYSPYVGFKGGKGIAVTAGAAGFLNPLCLFWGALAFFAVALTSRRVSLGSLTIALVYPPLCAFFYRGQPVNLALSVAVSGLIVFAHRANIGRLIRGEEPKVTWGIYKD